MTNYKTIFGTSKSFAVSLHFKLNSFQSKQRKLHVLSFMQHIIRQFIFCFCIAAHLNRYLQYANIFIQNANILIFIQNNYEVHEIFMSIQCQKWYTFRKQVLAFQKSWRRLALSLYVFLHTAYFHFELLELVHVDLI